MAKPILVTKKKLAAISNISVAHDALRNFDGYPRYIGGEPWYNLPPDTWNEDETRLWDAVHELEMKIKNEILEILNPDKKEGSNS